MLKSSILLLIFISTTVISSKICFQEPCSAAETTSKEDSYNEELEKCAKKGPMMMPFYYDNVDRYLCHTLLYQGQCGPGHWLVAKKFADKPIAECQKKICEEDEVMFHNECHKNDPTTLCGQFQILLLNPFGEGKYIACEKTQVCSKISKVLLFRRMSLPK